MGFPPVICYGRFFGLFSATFGQIQPFSGHQFFPAKNYFLGPVLSYLAGNSEIWQQWYQLVKSAVVSCMRQKWQTPHFVFTMMMVRPFIIAILQIWNFSDDVANTWYKVVVPDGSGGGHYTNHPSIILLGFIYNQGGGGWLLSR
jgi:hypothetical protein